MSTIKVNNIQNTSGGSSSTPEEIQQGRAKAWVRFKSNGTQSIYDSYNVSSVTDDAYGRFTVNFSNAFSNANYVFYGNCSSGGDNGNESVLSLHSSNSNAQTSLCKFRVTKTINGDYNEKDTTAIGFIGDN
tara:strand:- start:229 stop:621 length:393 start_codon:yes stop_codon:yes gene_type:complete